MITVVHDAYALRIELTHLERDHPDMSMDKIRAAELTVYNGGDEPVSVTLDESAARELAAALLAGFAPPPTGCPDELCGCAPDPAEPP